MRATVQPWGRRLSCVPGGIVRPGAAQTNGGAIIEQRCCLGGINSDISPPASTPRADARNVGEEIMRSATSTAASFHCSTADVAEPAEHNRRPHIKSEKSPLFRSCHCYFPTAVDNARGQDPSRTKNLDEAPLWHCCRGYFSGGSDHVHGENTNNST